MTYQTKFWLYAALTMGSAMVAGFVISRVVPLSGGVGNPALVLPPILAMLALVMFAAWAWWQRTDDFQQQGQLLSWWWGGNAGAIIMLTVLVVLTGRHSELSLGAGILFLAQFAGFVIVWLVWKLRGRGATE
ncbi:MAG: hypothetical protein AAF559_13835 [Pseudomonadota bacterium]